MATVTRNLLAEARSLYGCWTCRVRKKKCDESRPACAICESLELECYGYGPRPDWMDNGKMQKEQSLKIKHVVNRKKLKKGRRQLLATTQSSQDLNKGLGVFSTEKMPSHLSSTSAHKDFSAWNAVTQDEFHYRIMETDLLSLLDPALSGPFYNNVSGTESLSQAPSKSMVKFHNYKDAQDSSLLSGSFEGGSILSPNLRTVSEVDPAKFYATPREDMQSTSNGQFLPNLGEVMCDPYSCGKDTLEETTSNQHISSTSLVPEYFVPFKPQLMIQCKLNPSGRTEDALFMHYLDEVFYVQYPFYHSCGREERGWLFSILKRGKSAYHAALALSEHHLVSTLPQGSDITKNHFQAKEFYHNLALQGVQLIMDNAHTWNRCTRLVQSLEGLTSILQLLFSELFAGGRNNWQQLLRTASRLIPTLLEVQMRITTPDYTVQDGKSEQRDKEPLDPSDQTAVGFLLGSFISFDIISSASTRSTPFLDINHLLSLGTLGISSESLVGCGNSVMAIILEISLLDKWKQEAQDAHKLSTLDLAKRGSQIGGRLQQELVDIKNMSLARPTSREPAGMLSAPILPNINRIFVLSAMTYLHVVISGPHPELPEIARSVSDTIVALQNLEDPTLLRSVVWPFCVTGCLALKEQQGYFQDLVSRAKITQWTVGTCYEAFKIMEECWEKREAFSCSCDWVTIMNQRGHYVLLR